MLVVKTENIFTGWQKTFQTEGSLKLKVPMQAKDFRSRFLTPSKPVFGGWKNNFEFPSQPMWIGLNGVLKNQEQLL
jgi:hypothetical protein